MKTKKKPQSTPKPPKRPPGRPRTGRADVRIGARIPREAAVWLDGLGLPLSDGLRLALNIVQRQYPDPQELLGTILDADLSNKLNRPEAVDP
jgi:hypothetical protein